jgi:trigger factor
MKSTLVKLPKSRVRLTVHVPKSKVQEAIDHAFDKLGGQIEIKGFRKGQAPKPIIFEAVGLSRIREAVFERLLPDTYFSELQKHKLVPVEGPTVNIKSEHWESSLPQGKATHDVDYEAEVDILPQVALIKDYKRLRLAERYRRPVEPEVTEDEVNGVIDHLRRQQAQFQDVKRPAKAGDRMEIEFGGKIAQVARQEFSSKNYPLILGNQTLLPEFESKLVGMRKGESKGFTVEIPAKDDPAKKEKVDFTVTVLQLQEVILPELTDEFGQETVLSLRGAVRAGLRANKEERHRKELEQAVADEVLKTAEVEVPESLIHQEIHRIIDALKAQAQSYGLMWENYLAQLKKTEADLHHDLEQQAEKTVTFGLVLGYIMSKEKINPKSEQAGRRAMDRLIEYLTKTK